MILKPLRKDQFECLRSILQARLEEANLTTFTSVDFVLAKLETTYGMHCAGAYVDDFDAPKHCLIISHFPSTLIPGTVAYINLIYSLPSARGNPEDVKVLFDTAENYARLNGAIAISGSSWVFRGSKGTDALWKSHKYEAQEITYLKTL